MSRRTAEASRAVALAWTNEQQRVQEGKGTRDWTPEQQKDILERGKAYDDKGRAFEGQHMKSVEKYPEYQGDPDNIQFLTKEEHLEAHQGNWQNPTNWYFNPVTKEITDFGDGKYIPCAVIDLSDPVSKLSGSMPSSEVSEKDSVVSEKETETSSKTTKSVEEKHKDTIPKKASIPVEPKKSIFEKIGDGIAHIKDVALNFAAEHPVITAIALTVGGTVVKEAIDHATSGGGSGSGNNTYRREDSYSSNDGVSDDDLSDASESEDIDFDEPTEDSDSEERAPQTKRPHDTRGYTRLRRGKEEKVRGYSTGKNREKTDDDE